MLVPHSLQKFNLSSCRIYLFELTVHFKCIKMNSLLNPEAPEFYPLLTSISQDGYATVNKTIRSSNLLPSKQSYDLFKTFTDFHVVSSKLSNNVVHQSNQIISTELPRVKLKRIDLEYNMDKVVDCNDSMLDRVSGILDRLDGSAPPQVCTISPWNEAPVLAKIQVGRATFLGAKNVPRPQLCFKDTIDNSDSLWVPKISDKPNNFKPLALNILYNDGGEAVGYEHPYQVELDLYQPPSEFLCPSPAPAFPAPLEQSPVTFVETAAQVDDLINHLAGVSELAVDVEHHSYRTYQGITCLMQISTADGRDFIVDALAAREHLHRLNVIFTDPNKLKVFHGAEMDVIWLQRDFGLYIVGLFDTYQAAKMLKLNGLSLKAILLKYCNIDADKKYQLADWRIRPLPEELVRYARLDTHYLLYTWRMMQADLLQASTSHANLLHAVFQNSRLICAMTYNKEVITEESHMRLLLRSKKSFNTRQLAVLKMLYQWRDSNARELDESTTYLLPNHMLLALAEALPRDVQSVLACCQPAPPFIKQNLMAIHRMILSCREMPLEPQLYRMPPSLTELANSKPPPSLAYNVHDLSQMQLQPGELKINLELAEAFLAPQPPGPEPDILVFSLQEKPLLGNQKPLVSALNAEAKLFIPPYDRYRKYRALAQMEEIKEFKEKEAKIAAISKGNAMIQKEVLSKLQQATAILENEANPKPKPVDEIKLAPPIVSDADNVNPSKNRRRKRKISNNKTEKKETSKDESLKEDEKANEEPNANEKHKTNEQKNKNDYTNKHSSHFKAFLYKNANYKKFYDDSDKTHKVPKQKFKKRK